MAKRRKLYFDVSMTTRANASSSWALAPCTAGFPPTINEVENTEIRARVPVEADTTQRQLVERYGGFLDSLPALTLGSPPETKRRNAVAAWIELQNTGSFEASSGNGVDVHLFFVRPFAFAPTDSFFIKDPPSEAFVMKGSDAVYATEFGVGIQINTSGAVGSQVFRGILYVQRQHSIEV